MKQKKRELYKMRNHFSRHRKKTKHGKITYFFEKAQQKRKQRKRSFFDGKEKTEKEILAEA